MYNQKNMNIHIKTTNLTLTPDIESYLDKKMESMEKIIDPNDTSIYCQVELAKTTNHHKSGDIYKAEFNFRKGGEQFRAVSEQETLMAAIDLAKDELVRELKSHHSKEMTMVRRGGAAVKNLIKGIGAFGGSVGGSIGRGVGKNFKRFRR
jgi:ribosomal subunit interface protein